jgi:hypothetical protein
MLKMSIANVCNFTLPNSNPAVMKHSLLLSVLSIGLLSGCATAYKAGQTPDDVYYSPGRNREAIVQEDDQKKQEEQYQDYVSSLDDRYLRMKVANRNRWGALDNFDYWYDSRYDFNSYNYYTINPYSSWNPGWNLSLGYGYGGRFCPGGGSWGWSSPIYTVVHYTSPSFGSTSGSNITAYRNKVYSNTNYGYRDPKSGAFVPGTSNSNFGSLLKKVFSGSSENASSYDRPARTFTTPSNSNTSMPSTSSSAGGTSGGFKSTGTSTSTGRGGKG